MNEELDAALIDSCPSFMDMLEIVEEECMLAWSNDETWRWNDLADQREWLRAEIDQIDWREARTN